jgi:hypothetical protein
MRTHILAAVITGALTGPGSAENGNFERFLGGVIVGAVIVDALQAPRPQPPRQLPTPVYPTPQPPPPVVYHTAHPLRVCIEDIEHGPGWAYLYEYNCSGELLSVTRLR